MLGARAGSLYRNVVAHTRDLGASGDRAPVRQQPWPFNMFCFEDPPPLLQFLIIFHGGSIGYFLEPDQKPDMIGAALN